MGDLNLDACDREPIHIPGAIQPHGALLVLNRKSLVVEQAAGSVEAWFGAPAAALLGRAESEVLGAGAAALHLADSDAQPAYAGGLIGADGTDLDVVAHLADDKLIVEFEAAPPRRRSGAELARIVEDVSARFAGARTISQLCDLAAAEFRTITGFDRVMIYRFLPDETGTVVAEAKIEKLQSFLNHRYPASDIPRQARELYVRNVIRVIPDAGYAPSPLVGEDPAAPLDMSQVHLRSVSPIHIQYLHNMGVVASASISIIRDGQLWGLVSCHHGAPWPLSFDDRTLCRLLAGALSQRLAGIEDAELLQARLRSRALEDELLALLSRERSAGLGLSAHADDLLATIPAHGVAVRHGRELWLAGRCPAEAEILALGDWLAALPAGEAYASADLSRAYPPAAAFPQAASGLLAVTISAAEPQQILWFRAEQIEVIEWAGNPHKAAEAGEAGMLTPRKSFELWRETVRGRSDPWMVTEIESAERIARSVGDLQRSQSITALNDSLRKALGDRDSQLAQQKYLLREGDHRIQNSLQILSGMLSMQLRETSDPVVRPQLEEALSRVHAVSAVHRRLFRTDQPHVVQLDIYLQELLADIGASLGDAWSKSLTLHPQSVPAPTEVAMSVGLVVTELVLNAVKYAYDGQAGPIQIDLESRGERLRLSVRDWGRGQVSARPKGGGFGSKLMAGLLERLQGDLQRRDAGPGLRVTVDAPLNALDGGSGAAP